MKTNALLPIILAFLTVSIISAQKADKKVQTFTTEHVINAPADKVWQVIGDEYADIYKSHPKIITSNYINGSSTSGVGAERVCNFNDSNSKFITEKITDYDPENYTMTIDIVRVKKLPINTEYSYAIQKVVPINPSTSKMVFTMYYRTKPGFLGGLAKGSFKKGIRDYAIAIDHYINTGERVTKDNFKAIKKQYCKAQKESK